MLLGTNMALASRLLLVFLFLARLPGKDAQQCGSDPSAPVCSSDETCCEDSAGCSGVCSECCLNQVDKCVLPRPGFESSTCCPKWTVGCSSGSVGCVRALNMGPFAHASCCCSLSSANLSSRMLSALFCVRTAVRPCPALAAEGVRTDVPQARSALSFSDVDGHGPQTA